MFLFELCKYLAHFYIILSTRGCAREMMRVVQNGKLLAWNFWKSFPKRKSSLYVRRCLLVTDCKLGVCYLECY